MQKLGFGPKLEVRSGFWESAWYEVSKFQSFKGFKALEQRGRLEKLNLALSLIPLNSYKSLKP